MTQVQELVQTFRRGQRHHRVADVGFEREQPLRLEATERLAHRRIAYAELTGEGGDVQALTWGQHLIDDELVYRVADLFDKPVTRNDDTRPRAICGAHVGENLLTFPGLYPIGYRSCSRELGKGLAPTMIPVPEKGQFSRRRFLELSASVAGGVVFAACGQPTLAAAASAASVAAAPLAKQGSSVKLQMWKAPHKPAGEEIKIAEKVLASLHDAIPGV